MKRTSTNVYRKLAIYGFEAVERSHNFVALLDFDITNLRSLLRAKRSEGSGGSLFAFLLKAIGKCLEKYPELNSMVNLRKTTVFDTVDIAIPIEIDDQGTKMTKQLTISDINGKSLTEVDREISASRQRGSSEKGYVSSKMLVSLINLLPRFVVNAIYGMAINNHERVKRLSGTVFVTSVSMFSNAPGYIIPYSGGPKAVSFAIGSSVKKPVVYKDAIAIREMINITAIFNHDCVDGASAARFINQLRNYIEKDYSVLMGNDA